MIYKSERDKAKEMVADVKKAIAEGKGGPGLAITEASNARIAELEEELAKLLVNKQGGNATVTPATKKKMENIFKQMEDIITANSGDLPARSLFQNISAQLKESSRPWSIAKNAAGFAVCVVGVKLLTAFALVAMPWSLGALAAGAVLFGVFKLCSYVAKGLWNKWNDSPGARMDAAAERAGLKSDGPKLLPSGATPSVVVNNIQGGRHNTTAGNQPGEDNKKRFSL